MQKGLKDEDASIANFETVTGQMKDDYDFRDPAAQRLAKRCNDIQISIDMQE